MKKYRFKNIFLVCCLTVSLTSCLKTRGQLREESDGEDINRPIPVQPAQDVQPKGQYVLDEIKSEFTRLEGRVDDLEHEHKMVAATKTNNNFNEDLKKLETRLTQLEQNVAQMGDALKKIQEEKTVNSAEVFKKAQAQFQKGDYEAAASLLGSYLKSPQASKAEEATFLKGESHYFLKQYQKAIVEYSKFPEKFSHSKRVPAVLYRIGLSFEAMGMKEDAKGFFQELVEKYPKSPEAKKAKKKAK